MSKTLHSTSMARQKILLKLRVPLLWVVQATSTRFLFLVTLAVVLVTITYSTRDRSLRFPSYVEQSSFNPFKNAEDMEIVPLESEQPIELQNSAEDVAIVAAKTANDDVQWLYQFCENHGCTPYIYNMDLVPEEGLEKPYFYQGHEASAYLAYLVDYYDKLHPYTIFIHGREDQWHNDIAGPKTSNVLSNLRLEAVEARGYVNLRCASNPGCPSTLHQRNPVNHDQQYQYLLEQLPEILHYLLGIDPVDFPENIGHQCCAQFAVSRAQIQKRSQAEYRKIMLWTGTTDMTDNYGIGWLTEKIWHMMFGMPPELCQTEEQCRCDLYGWCGPNPSTGNIALTPISY